MLLAKYYLTVQTITHSITPLIYNSIILHFLNESAHLLIKDQETQINVLSPDKKCISIFSNI